MRGREYMVVRYVRNEKDRKDLIFVDQDFLYFVYIKI